MHDGELAIDLATATTMLYEQFVPSRSHEVTPVDSRGTVHVLYRIGREFVARFPRLAPGADEIRQQAVWMARLRGQVHCETPTPVLVGEPRDPYPWPWLVTTWIPGVNPSAGTGNRIGLVRALARFATSLHEIDCEGAPLSSRGVDLIDRDRDTRAALDACTAWIDVEWAREHWASCLEQPVPERRVLIHGDLSGDNVVVRDDTLSGVIDFDTLTSGDAACDLLVAWNLFSRDERREFRAATKVDDATWRRGRGWAMSVAAIQLPYYVDRNPPMAQNAIYTLTELANDPD